MSDMNSPPPPPVTCCPVHLPISPGALGPSSLVSKPSHLLLLGQKFSTHIKCGFCFPAFRKEVGLDLFFPKQMQENLKVREAESKEPREPCSMWVLRQELESQERRILALGYLT